MNISNKNNLVLRKKVKKTERQKDLTGVKEVFRLSAKNLFLTYSSTPKELTREEVLNQLKDKPNLKIKDYIISLEYHQDGKSHFHVFLVLYQRCDLRNPKDLDLYFNEKVIHGKYESARSAKKSKEYLFKTDKEPLTNLLLEFYEGKLITAEERAFLDLKELGKEKVLQNYIKKYPFRAVKKLSALETTLKKAERIINPKIVFKEPNYSLKDLMFQKPELQQLIIDKLRDVISILKYNKLNPENVLPTRAYLFYGKPGFGKSVVMKAFLKELPVDSKIWVSTKEQLKYLVQNPNAVGYDEFESIEFTNSQLKGLFDSSNTSEQRVLYDSIEKSEGIILLLSANSGVSEILKRPEILTAILRRVTFIHVDSYIEPRTGRDINVNINININVGPYNLDELPHPYSLKHPDTLNNIKLLGLDPSILS